MSKRSRSKKKDKIKIIDPLSIIEEEDEINVHHSKAQLKISSSFEDSILGTKDIGSGNLLLPR